MQRSRTARYSGKVHETARAFFRRISIKFRRRFDGSLPSHPGASLTTADRIARDWRPITQRPPIDPTVQDRLFAQLPSRLADVDLSHLDDPITEEEVLGAIKACPRGKACGPDGLPNEWYRDLAPTLASVLAPLFFPMVRGVLPASFGTASVYCIPKKKKPTSGLDFRPMVASSSAIRGLALSESVAVQLVGFADDTTAYLANEVRALATILDDFRNASGLRVNIEKSIGVRLAPVTTSTVVSACIFPLASEVQLVRYQGGQIATTLSVS